MLREQAAKNNLNEKSDISPHIMHRL